MKNSSQSSAPVITIDGPGGTGKGTISLMLAKHLAWHFLDSGMLYRVLALAAKNHEISWQDERALARLGQNLDVEFISGLGESARVLLLGKDVTEELRSEVC